MADKKAKISGDTVYRKVGKRYEPFGMCTPENWFNEGIWVLRKGKNSESYTSADYLYEMVKVCNLSNTPTLQELSSIDEYANSITSSEEWRKFINGSHSLNDIIKFILVKAFEHNQEISNKKETI